MADKKKGSAYGTASTDTEFRRDFDPAAAADRAAEKEAADRAEAKARYEARLAGKKYVRQPTGAEALISARRAALDVSDRVGKVQLVPAGAGQGKRGRGAGFYCEACDLTFKDNRQFVDHLNTMQHLIATGHTGQVKRASAEEVRERILWHVNRRKELEAEKTVSLEDRLAMRERERAVEAEERKARRKEAEEKKRLEREEAEKAKVDYGEDVRIEGEHDEDDMMAQMGFTGFGMSKK
ncbi:related to C2H2 finger domain protein [Cephalotrichum gorgonifer]|uniref:Related to C2H2 finger domain protein n=1 Tax=Cephalotrichum gorgonifer TaxID=2041049 RepID=A0AAE8MQX7_9PEZI|nr:related to C2H2 finger domain protein [Cephalotrichum gorgonifer]